METSNSLFFALKITTALDCGLIAGAFFAFSTFVMSALARLKPSQGILAMQFINITVINPWFMTAFFGAAVACLGLAISALLNLSQPVAIYLLMGSLFYLLGVVLVTIGCNVPLNNALAIADPYSPDGAKLWASYQTNWTNWNHVRTVAALAASLLFIISVAQ
jgi:uncharacterized membrane protein